MFIKIETKVAGNTDVYVHSLMLTVEKQRSLHLAAGGSLTGKSSRHAAIDLNQFNIQYGNELDEQNAAAAATANNNNNSNNNSFISY